MRKRHLLTGRAFKFPNRPSTAPQIPGAEYDARAGFWRSAADGQALVREENSREVFPSTKKFDIETGEDAKGE
jgi:hypothetical protein